LASLQADCCTCCDEYILLPLLLLVSGYKPVYCQHPSRLDEFFASSDDDEEEDGEEEVRISWALNGCPSKQQVLLGDVGWHYMHTRFSGLFV
jgi:hypothetical protein